MNHGSVSFLSLPDGLIDLLTIVLLAMFLFLSWCDRIIIPRVQSISTPYDYLLLFITAAPFLTGFFAYHQWFDYKTVITLHILAEERRCSLPCPSPNWDTWSFSFL